MRRVRMIPGLGRAVVEAEGHPGFDKLSGYGRVNAWRALTEPSPASTAGRSPRL